MLVDCIQFDAQKNSIPFLSAVCPSVFSFLFVKFHFLFLAQIAKTLSRSSYPMVRGCESHHYQWEGAERRSMSPSLVCRACSPLWRLRGTIAFNCFTSALACIRHLKDRELGCHLISEMQGFLLYTQTHSTGWNTQLRLWTGWGSSVGDWKYSYSVHRNHWLWCWNRWQSPSHWFPRSAYRVALSSESSRCMLMSARGTLIINTTPVCVYWICLCAHHVKLSHVSWHNMHFKMCQNQQSFVCQTKA